MARGHDGRTANEAGTKQRQRNSQMAVRWPEDECWRRLKGERKRGGAAGRLAGRSKVDAVGSTGSTGAKPACFRPLLTLMLPVTRPVSRALPLLHLHLRQSIQSSWSPPDVLTQHARRPARVLGCLPYLHPVLCSGKPATNCAPIAASRCSLWQAPQTCKRGYFWPCNAAVARTSGGYLLQHARAVGCFVYGRVLRVLM